MLPSNTNLNHLHMFKVYFDPVILPVKTSYFFRMKKWLFCNLMQTIDFTLLYMLNDCL